MEPVTGRTKLLHRALLALIVVIALASRVVRCAEGLPYLHNWDEPQIASTALTMMKTGDLNPHFFNYGSLMIYANLAVDAAEYLHLMLVPQGKPGSLKEVWEIETEHDTGYHWTISHPSFYLWNRLLTAMMGAASVLLVYRLGCDLKGPWAGLIAAGLLTGIEPHVAESSLALPNVPASFFCLLAVTLAVHYLATRRWLALVGSSAAAGLAAATKYNAGVAVLVPCVALLLAWWLGRERREGLIAAVLLLPPLVFVAATPYAVLDLPHFLEDVGYEVRHYAAAGGPGRAVEPGLSHLMLDLGTLAGTIGWVPALIAVVGAGVALTTAAGWTTMALPLAYLLFMSSTRIAEDRNLVVVHPYAAIAFGCGCVAIVELAAARFAALRPERRRSALLAVAAVPCALAIGPSSIVSARLARAQETRSRAIDAVNEMGEMGEAVAGDPPGRVGVAAELRIHALDLARLRPPHDEGPLLDLMCDAGSYGTIVAPRDLKSARIDEDESVALMNSLIQAKSWTVRKLDPGRSTQLDYINIDPAVLLLSRTAGAPPPVVCSEPLSMRAAGDAPSEDAGEVNLWGGRSASTAWAPLGAGKHSFVWSARGDWQSYGFPRIRATLRQRMGGMEWEARPRELELSGFDTPYAIDFEALEGAEASMTFEWLEGKQVSVGFARVIGPAPSSPAARKDAR